MGSVREGVLARPLLSLLPMLLTPNPKANKHKTSKSEFICNRTGLPRCPCLSAHAWA